MKNAIAQNVVLKDLDLEFPKYEICMVCHQEKSLTPAPDSVYWKLPSMEVTQHLRKN